MNNIHEFIPLYPMHLYPLVAKSLALTFIEKNIDKIADKIEGGITELAIGEGSFSKKIFSKRNISIFGLDLNPYSLIHTKNCKHISKSIVADCTNPPLAYCGASLILSNNFLHHVNNKEYCLNNWSKISAYAIFNENTNYWASGWLIPYLLKTIGLPRAAKKIANKIAERGLQALWTHEQLKAAVEKYFEFIEEKSFLNERVFFLCSICSFLLLCYGPPTPKFPKAILKSSLLWPITKFMTFNMAKTLIEYDALLPRNNDVFIYWTVKSKAIQKIIVLKEAILACPHCHETIEDNKCPACNNIFEERDGMLFLLPRELVDKISYCEDKKTILEREHL